MEASIVAAINDMKAALLGKLDAFARPSWSATCRTHWDDEYEYRMKMACIVRYQNSLTFLGFLKCHVDLANHLYFQAREREII